MAAPHHQAATQWSTVPALLLVLKEQRLSVSVWQCQCRALTPIPCASADAELLWRRQHCLIMQGTLPWRCCSRPSSAKCTSSSTRHRQYPLPLEHSACMGSRCKELRTSWGRSARLGSQAALTCQRWAAGWLAKRVAPTCCHPVEAGADVPEVHWWLVKVGAHT